MERGYGIRVLAWRGEGSSGHKESTHPLATATRTGVWDYVGFLSYATYPWRCLRGRTQDYDFGNM